MQCQSGQAQFLCHCSGWLPPPIWYSELNQLLRCNLHDSFVQQPMIPFSIDIQRGSVIKFHSDKPVSFYSGSLFCVFKQIIKIAFALRN